MSSPKITRMLGFLAGAWAKPDTAVHAPRRISGTSFAFMGANNWRGEIPPGPQPGGEGKAHTRAKCPCTILAFGPWWDSAQNFSEIWEGFRSRREAIVQKSRAESPI